MTYKNPGVCNVPCAGSSTRCGGNEVFSVYARDYTLCVSLPFFVVILTDFALSAQRTRADQYLPGGLASRGVLEVVLVELSVSSPPTALPFADFPSLFRFLGNDRTDTFGVDIFTTTLDTDKSVSGCLRACETATIDGTIPTICGESSRPFLPASSVVILSSPSRYRPRWRLPLDAVHFRLRTI